MWANPRIIISAITEMMVSQTDHVFIVSATLMWSFESGLPGSDIHGFGDALFFATMQILTVSSSVKNPVTHGGQIVDVVLEFWAVFIVTAVAGSFASFFLSGDQAPG